MKKDPYAYVSTPEFSKNRTKKESALSQDIQNMNNENKNNGENESLFSFGNNCSYHEINECSDSMRNSEKQKDLLPKPSGNFAFSELISKNSRKESPNKIYEMVTGRNDPTRKYKSRNNEKIIINYTETHPKNILNLPDSSNLNSKSIKKDITILNRDKKNQQKNDGATEMKKIIKKRAKNPSPPTNKSVFPINNNTHRNEKKNDEPKFSANIIKTTNTGKNTFNKNSLSIKKETAKKSNKDIKFNNALYASDLQKKQINIEANPFEFGNYNQKNDNLNKIHSEDNAHRNINIQNPKKNKPIEETVKNIADNVEKLTLIVLDLSLAQYEYLESQKEYNKKLDSYIEKQNTINEKLDKFIDGQLGVDIKKNQK